MDAWGVAVALIACLVGVAMGAIVVRRITTGRVKGLESDLARSSDALQHQELSSREQRRVQDLVLSSMQEGVLLIDGQGAFAFANPALTLHLGDALTGVTHLYPQALREAVLAVGSQRVVRTVEFERGEPARWLRATAAPAGSDGSILLVVTDITDMRRVEAMRRDFVANASHELKTPTASIQAVAETLASVAVSDPDAVPRFATQLEREAKRLSRIVADLLDLSRLEAGGEKSEPVRLDALVREEGERFEERCREAGVTLRIATDGAATVSGAARDLSLLIRNLIDNALQYTSPGGRIDVGVAVEGDAVALLVDDDGVGIPSRDLPRVFERFYRVDRARSRETGGTGLGLAIVKHVAENHGGTVDVTSELGQGSRFVVRIPSLP
jgi:signal transduction histidine kinase